MTSVREFGRLLLSYRFAAPALLAATFIMVASRGARLADDSGTYIEGAVFRTPVYPLFLDLLELALPGSFLTAAALVQLTIGLLAADGLVRELRRLIPVTDWIYLGILMLLLFPYSSRLEVGTAILSEGLAYPLFLLSMRFLFSALADLSYANLTLHFLFWVAAVLTRPQFLFMLIVTAPMVLYWLHRDFSLKAAVRVLFLLSTAVVISLLADRTYHFLRHGSFTQIPFTGIQLMASALYLSHPDDPLMFDPREADLLATLQEDAEAAGLTVRQNDSPGGLVAFSWHFRASYNDLVWRTIFPVVTERMDADAEATAADYLRIDRALTPLALKLVARHKKRWCKLYLSNILTSVGATHLLLLLLATAAAAAHSVRTREAATLLFATAALAHLANCLLVAVVEPAIPRYLFYTEMVYAALAVLTVLRLPGLRASG